VQRNPQFLLFWVFSAPFLVQRNPQFLIFFEFSAPFLAHRSPHVFAMFGPSGNVFLMCFVYTNTRRLIHTREPIGVRKSATVQQLNIIKETAALPRMRLPRPTGDPSTLCHEGSMDIPESQHSRARGRTHKIARSEAGNIDARRGGVFVMPLRRHAHAGRRGRSTSGREKDVGVPNGASSLPDIH
jgi:hypothetical protein